ncbi:hypothetical protein [Thiothrix winogradskyi]|uniref:Lipoprotein n=1 Tax=Thiothrix winogradskyi TaxID=96472 RepID=A0ABY3SXT1_9GAMM|nr:hypothetical protein [Thiothrix winogradskyi]UJS23712.1 hypothetical protein L2Y54_17490 [Thiothrix winogradskyi]
MKNYWFATLLLLAGCEDKNLASAQQGQVTVQKYPVSTTSAPPQVIPNNPPLLNQHMQENTSVYPHNSVQLAVDQGIKAIAVPIQQDLLAIMGTDLQSVDTTFNGQRITFQYQVWKIQKPSVCSHAQQNAMQFSECTQAAKQLFQSMCGELQQEKQHVHPRNQQLQRMYCQAAVDFKPTVAQISRSEPQGDDKLQTLRKNCNDLIFKAKISEDVKDEKARDQVCQAYKKAAHLN